jgi:P27 family predicted phage terminase small subunit
MTRLDPPQHFDDERRHIWAETVTRLTSSGRVFRADPEVLGTYVEAVRSHRQASRLLAQTNVMITRDGIAMENPALAIQRKSAEAMARASRALGLNWAPSGRDGDPIAEESPAVPIAPPAQRRWCEEHQRGECKHRRQDGSWCHQYRLVAGLDVCRKHGGKTIEQLREDGRVRALEAQAARLLYRHDAAPVTNPLEALQSLAGRALALEQVIGEKVNELRSLRYETEGGGEQIRGELQVLERAMDRCGRMLTDIAKLGIEDRLAVIREKTARMLEEALTAALQKSGADLGGQAAAREEFRRRLRIVA